MSAAKSPGLVVLDGLRGGAASYVMIGHALWLLTLEAGPRAGRPWWECLSAIYLTFQPTLPRHFGLAAGGIVLSALLSSFMARRLERVGR